MSRRKEFLVILGLLATSLITFYIYIQGIPFFSKYTNIQWLSLVEIVEWKIGFHQIKFPSLFILTMQLLKSFYLDSPQSLIISAALTFIIFPIPSYLLLSKSLDSKTGIISWLIMLIYPIYAILLRTSMYWVLQGIFLLSLSIYVFSVLESKVKPVELYKFILIFIFSVLTVFADLTAGLIFFLYMILHFAYKLKSGEENLNQDLKLLLASLPSLVFPLLGLMYPLFPQVNVESISLNLSSFIVIVVAGVLGFHSIRKEYPKIASTLLIWSLSSALALISPIQSFYAYISYPLIMLTSCLLSVKTTGLFSVEKAEGGEEAVIEVDLEKLASIAIALLLIALSVSSLLTLPSLDQPLYAEQLRRYGDREVLEVMDWISKNTPKSAVIASEYPLGVWIETYTGRKTITTLPVAYSDNPRLFLEGYDVESILNANYEIRNSRVRVRDWGSTAPQRSPIIASSNGEKYVDFLYIDENHVNVRFLKNGKEYSVSFYDYNSSSSLWLERTSAKAILLHRYQVFDVIVERRVTLEDGLPKVLIEYNVSSSYSKITGFSLKLWIPWERRIGFTHIEGNVFQFSTESGNYRVTFHGSFEEVSYRPDEVWSQPRVLVTYRPKASRVYAEIVVEALDSTPLPWSREGVIAVSDEELLAKYKVAYLVIPTIVKKEFMDRFGLDYATFQSAFENEKLTVYKVVV